MTQLLVKAVFAEDVRNANATAGALGRVRRSNALSSGTDVGLAQFDLFQTVHLGVQIKVNVASVADQHTVLGINALLLQCFDFLE